MVNVKHLIDIPVKTQNYRLHLFSIFSTNNIILRFFELDVFERRFYPWTWCFPVISEPRKWLRESEEQCKYPRFGGSSILRTYPSSSLCFHQLLLQETPSISKRGIYFCVSKTHEDVLICFISIGPRNHLVLGVVSRTGLHKSLPKVDLAGFMKFL